MLLGLRLLAALVLGCALSLGGGLAPIVPPVAASTPLRGSTPVAGATSSPHATAAASASAQARRAGADPPGPAFDCAVPTWFLGQGQPTTTLWTGTFTDQGSAVLGQLGGPFPQYNAIGFDPIDHYIYGILNPTGAAQLPGATSSDLLQIDSTGGVTNLGAVTGLPPVSRNVGAFDDAGNFWVTNASTGAPATTLYEISIATRSVIQTRSLTGSGFTASDFTFANGFMWGLQDRTLLRMNLGTGAVTSFANAVNVDTGIYGAAWTFGNGNLGFSNNVSGRIFQISVTNPAAATPTFTLVGAPITGPASGNNDGTSCISPAVDLGIVKSGPAWVAEGGTVTWTLTVTNHGPGNSGGYAVTDLVPPGVTNVQQVLANPGDTSACDVTGNPVRCSLGALPNSSSFTITLAGTVSAAAGSCFTNTATVLGHEVDPNPANDSSSLQTCVLGVRLAKSADVSSFDAPGVPISYTYTVSNPSAVDLTLVSLTDDPLGSVSCAQTTIPAHGSIVCSKLHDTSQGEVDAGGISNTATVTALGPDDIHVSAQASHHVPATQTPGISLVKTADVSSFAAPGTEIGYRYEVRNTGNVTLDPVAVVDPLDGLSGLTCVPAEGSALAPNKSMTCQANYLTTQADVDAGAVRNKATAVGQPPSGDAVTAADEASVPATRSPRISLVKTATPPGFAAAGNLITYRYLVRNTGNVTLDPVTVTDSRLGTVTSCPESTLPPRGLMICEVGYRIRQVDVDRGFVANTATATGQPPPGAGPPVTDRSAAIVRLSHAPAIGLAKQADISSFDAPGTRIHYTFTVSNAGNVTLHLIRLSDNRLGQISCPRTSLAVGGSMTCTATYTTTQADLDTGQITNTATVSGLSPHGRRVTAQDGFTLTAEQNPAIRVRKTASPASFTAAGTRLRYGYRVTNTGNVTLNPVTLVDNRLGPVNCPAGSLAPGASMTCTATATTTQAELDAGGIRNVAAAVGTPPDGERVQSAAPLIVPGIQHPALRAAKTADPTSFTRPGLTITYSYRVVNTGNVTLDAVTLTDNRLGSVDCPAGSLAPGASMTCTATATTTQADLDAGGVTNLATAAGVGPHGQRVTGLARARVTGVQRPAIRVVKAATYRNFSAPGTTITYLYLIVNTGNVTLHPVTLTDSRLGPITCPVDTLAPLRLTVCTARYTTTQADVDGAGITNTGTATGTAPNGSTVSDDATLTIRPVHNPAISLVKTASVPSFAEVGTPITYRYVVTNTGNVTLNPVTVTDPLPGLSRITCATAVPVLAPGRSTVCLATYTTTQADLNNGHIANTGTATGTAPDGTQVTDTDSVTVEATQAPAIGILKTTDPQSFTTAGTVIHYSYLVTNSGNVTLDPVTVTDDRLGSIGCPFTSLAPGIARTCTATYTSTQADVDAGSIVNTATATGTPPTGPNVSQQDMATVQAVPDPAISLTKTATPASFTTAGTVIHYSYQVTNTGNQTLDPVSVSDPLPGLSSVHCPGPPTGFNLAPGDSATCTASYPTIQADLDNGRIVNTAIAGGTTLSGTTVSDEDSATVIGTARPAISITKTATPASFDRPGTLISYRYRVTNTGNLTLTPVTVTDSRLGAICPNPTPPVLTLDPGASVTCTASYTTTRADLDHGGVTNTGTAAGTTPTGGTVIDQATRTVPATQNPAITITKSASVTRFDTVGTSIGYSYQVTNTGNVTLTRVSVTDPKTGLTPIVCQASTLMVGATMTCTASYTTTQADLNRGSLTNTGTATGTAPDGTQVSAHDTLTLDPEQAPAIALVKTASVPSFSAAGTTIRYRYRVTNDGNLTLDPVTVTDNLPGLSPISCPATRLAPGAGMTCTASYTTTTTDLERGQINNTGLATGHAPDGTTVTARTPLITPGPPPPAPQTSGPGLAATGPPPWLIWLAALAAAAVATGLATLASTHRRSQR